MERGLLARTLHSGSKTSAELSVNNKQRIDDTLHNGQLMLPQDGASRARQGGQPVCGNIKHKIAASNGVLDGNLFLLLTTSSSRGSNCCCGSSNRADCGTLLINNCHTTAKWALMPC